MINKKDVVKAYTKDLKKICSIHMDKMSEDKDFLSEEVFLKKIAEENKNFIETQAGDKFVKAVVELVNNLEKKDFGVDIEISNGLYKNLKNYWKVDNKNNTVNDIKPIKPISSKLLRNSLLEVILFNGNEYPTYWYQEDYKQNSLDILSNIVINCPILEKIDVENTSLLYSDDMVNFKYRIHKIKKVHEIKGDLTSVDILINDFIQKNENNMQHTWRYLLFTLVDINEDLGRASEGCRKVNFKKSKFFEFILDKSKKYIKNNPNCLDNIKSMKSFDMDLIKDFVKDIAKINSELFEKNVEPVEYINRLYYESKKYHENNNYFNILDQDTKEEFKIKLCNNHIYYLIKDIYEECDNIKNIFLRGDLINIKASYCEVIFNKNDYPKINKEMAQKIFKDNIQYMILNKINLNEETLSDLMKRQYRQEILMNEINDTNYYKKPKI